MGHFARLRHVHGVAALDLDHRRSRALGHRALCVRRDHFVVGRDQVPTRFVLPRRLRDRATQCLYAPGNPGVGHETRELRVPGGGSLIRDATDSLLSGANAVMYTSPATLGSFPASVITAPP